MKKWEIISKLKTQPFGSLRHSSGQVAQGKNSEFRIENIVDILLENRGIRTKREKDEFLNPQLNSVTPEKVGIDKTQLKKTLTRITKAIKDKEQIIVFGDYDVDGICGSAILWESLRNIGADVMPYIPHRIEEGYGLSVKGIENVRALYPKAKLIITVDNGIVANKAVDFASEQRFDVVITDHHVPSTTLPKALAIVHTTALCGTGVAYLLAQEIIHVCHPEQSEGSRIKKKKDSSAMPQNDNFKKNADHLSLVALATIADLVPLKGSNRVLTLYGLKELANTQRVGLIELYKEAGLDLINIGTYEVGHIIAPRLNAMGRMEYAMEALRLLCTSSSQRARELALKLGSTNRERQTLTQETVLHAVSEIRNSKPEIRKLLFITHESYQQGVIGLVAGKLVEEFYRPAIVVAKGKKLSKASARSVHGFNIIEFIRKASDLLVDAGGHPMAAGFTVETAKLTLLEKHLNSLADEMIDENTLTRTLRIDMELPFVRIDTLLYEEIQKLAPFGMGNPEPVFMSKKVIIEDMRVVGYGGKHLKLRIAQSSVISHQSSVEFDAIGFGVGEKAKELHIGDRVDIAYTISEDTWLARRSLGEGGNGDRRLQLKIKDIKPSQTFQKSRGANVVHLRGV